MSEAGTAELTSGDIQALPLSQGLKSGELRRVAAIDIGTNSTHLLVASVDPALGTFSIIQAEKSTTRLGERDPDTGDLSAAAMERGFETLRRFLELANSHQVEQVVTAATSAVREAPNGRDFLQSIKDFEAHLIRVPLTENLSYGLMLLSLHRLLLLLLETR